uniref:Uncharacterized protein n=1 Tax=Oryza punctata TaxID=4537 RepID=A0A0E0MDP4_ORYPU
MQSLISIDRSRRGCLARADQWHLHRHRHLSGFSLCQNYKRRQYMQEKTTRKIYISARRTIVVRNDIYVVGGRGKMCNNCSLFCCLLCNLERVNNAIWEMN